MPPPLKMRTAAEIAGYLNHGNFNHYSAIMESLAAEGAISTLIPGRGFEVLANLGDVIALDTDVSLDAVAAEVMETLESVWPALRDKLVAARWLMDAPAECRYLTRGQCATLCARARVASYFEPVWLEETRTREVRITGIADADVQNLLPVRWDDDAGIASLMTAAGCPPDTEGRYVEKYVRARIKIPNRRPRRPDATVSELSRNSYSQVDAKRVGGYMLNNDPADFEEVWNKQLEYAKLHSLYNKQKGEFVTNNLWAKENGNKFDRTGHINKSKCAKTNMDKTHEEIIRALIFIQRKRSDNVSLNEFCSILMGDSDGSTTSTPKNNSRFTDLILPSFQEALRIALHQRDNECAYASMLDREGLPARWQGPPDLRETWSEAQKCLRRALRRLRQWNTLFFPKQRLNWVDIYNGQKSN